MKPRLTAHLLAALLGVVFTAEPRAQTSAFTYQGQLTENGSPATGLYDLQFALYDSNDGLTVVGGPQTNNATAVSNGLFTVTLDFSAGVFEGSDRWLEIGVVTNGGGAFSPLSPRQQITSAPYAIKAANSASAETVSGTVDTSQLAGTISSNLLADGSVTVEKLASSIGVWTRSGSNVSYTAGQVGIGTADIAADLHVRGAGALGGVVISPGTPESTSQITLTENASASLGAIMRYDGAANEWQVLGLSGGGGVETSPHLVVTRDEGMVGVGLSPSAPFHVAGEIRSSGTNGGVITARNPNNEAAVAQLSWLNDVARIRIGGLGEGSANGFDIQGIGDLSLMRITGEGQVGIGISNPTEKLHVMGGVEATTFIGDGSGLTGLNADELTSGVLPSSGLSDTYSNAVTFNNASNSFSGSGGNLTQLNASELTTGTVPGSALGGTYSGKVVFDYPANAFTGVFSADPADSAAAPSFHWSGDNDTGLFSPGANTVALSTGGSERIRFTSTGEVGLGTTAPEGDFHIQGNSSTGSVIVTPNTANSQSQVLLCENTTASFGMILRYAGGDSDNPFHFIGWNGDVEGSPLMTIERTGGGNVGIGVSNPVEKLDVDGNIVATGTVTGSSDRNRKENFKDVDALEVLEKVLAMPIQRWNYIGEKETAHLGPVAQDFYGAFQVGMDEKHISMVDADGVALAAIQGLNQKLRQKETEITELKARMEKLEQILEHRLNGGAR